MERRSSLEPRQIHRHGLKKKSSIVLARAHGSADRRVRRVALIGSAATAALTSLFGPRSAIANIIKADTPAMNAAADWGGTAPTSTTLGEFNNTISSANESTLQLGAATSLLGLLFDNNLNGPVTIGNTGGFALTVYASGIDMSSANQDVTINSKLALGASQAWNVGTGRTLTIGGVISAAFSINKTGAGTLTLSATNTFGNNTSPTNFTLTAGTLNLNNTAAVGKGTFIINGGTIDTTNATAGLSTNNNAQTWGGDFTFKGTSNFNLETGAVTLNASNINLTVTANALTVGGVISGASDSISKLGAGTLALNGANTFATTSGALVVENGTVSSSNASGFGGGSIQLGDGVADGNNATLLSTDNGGTLTNAITVAATTSGVMTIEGKTNSQTFSGNITLNNALSLANVTSGQTTTFSGQITGSSGITIPSTNAGIVAITGANTSTFTGAVNVNGGILSFAANALGSTGGSGAITFGGGTLQFASGNTQDIASRIAGSSAANLDLNDNAITFASAIGSGLSGGLALSSSTAGGVLTVTGAQAYTGTTTINSGATLKLATGASLPNIAINSGLAIASGGIFDINGNGVTVGNPTAGQGTTYTNSGTFTNSSMTSAAVTINSHATAGTSGNFTGPMNITWNSDTANNNLGNVNTTGNLTINDNSVSSTANVTTANNAGTISYAGTSSVTSTITTVGSNVSEVDLTSTTSGLTLTNLAVHTSGVTTLTNLNNSGGVSLIVTNQVTGSGGLVLQNNGNLGGGVSLSAGANNSGTITNSGSGSGSAKIGATGLNVTGVIANNQASQLALITANTFEYTGAGTGLQVLAGTVVGWNSNAFGADGSGNAGLGTVTLGNASSSSASATLLGSGTTSFLTFANPIVLGSGSTGTLTVGSSGAAAGVAFTGGITGTNNLTLSSGASGTVSYTTAAVNNTGSLIITGAVTNIGAIGSNVQNINVNASTGELILSNTGFTGTTSLTAGTLNFVSGALGSGAINFAGNATLQWGTGVTDDLSANGITVASGETATLDLQSNNVTFSTTNGLTGSGNITKLAASSGILTLNAANNLSGNFKPATTGGTTLLKNANALQNATVAVQAGTTNGGITFDSSVSPHTFTFGNLSGAGNLSLTDNGGNPVSLQVGNNNGSSGTAYSGILSGTGSITKIGSGVLGISGSNTYQGGTTVNAGVLDVNNLTGSGLGSGSASVAGGTLGGTGSFSGALTVSSSGTVAPGLAAAVGTLTTGSTASLAAGTLSISINETTAKASELIANGVTLGGTLSLVALNSGTDTVTVGQNFTIVSDSSNSLSTTFAGLSNGASISDGFNTYSVNYSTSGVVLTDLTTSAPEPGSFGLLALGGFGLLGRRRRRFVQAAIQMSYAHDPSSSDVSSPCVSIE